MLEQEVFSIGEVADQTELSIHTLRYYEQIGLISPVQRDENGYRMYTSEDIYRIETLLKLRATGMPVKDMVRMTEMYAQGATAIDEILALYRTHKKRVQEQMDELQQMMDYVNFKIALFEDKQQKQDKEN